MLLSNLTTLVRDFSQDTIAPYRWSDDMLVRFINQGLLEAKQIRPDLFIALDNVVPEYTAANLADGTLFPIDDMYLFPLAQFVTSMVEMTDDEFANDGRAVAFLNLYRQALRGVSNGS